jgi:glycosyltransferase involved in cell wall biosynthesis
VTVVIPLFDGERYVADAIESVLAQDRAVHEVVVVDDGSADQGAEVASAYGPPVRVVRQEHRGAGAARNHGASVATGDLLCFLDADDLLAADAIGRHLAVLESHPDIDGTYGEIAEFVDEPAEAMPGIRPPRATGPVRLPSTMVLRKAAFVAVGPFDETLRRSEGLDWLARAGDHALQLRPVAGAVLRRRLHAANNGMREIDDVGEYARTIKRVLDRRRSPS